MRTRHHLGPSGILRGRLAIVALAGLLVLGGSLVACWGDGGKGKGEAISRPRGPTGHRETPPAHAATHVTGGGAVIPPDAPMAPVNPPEQWKEEPYLAVPTAAPLGFRAHDAWEYVDAENPVGNLPPGAPPAPSDTSGAPGVQGGKTGDREGKMGDRGAKVPSPRSGTPKGTPYPPGDCRRPRWVYLPELADDPPAGQAAWHLRSPGAETLGASSPNQPAKVPPAPRPEGGKEGNRPDTAVGADLDRELLHLTLRVGGPLKGLTVAAFRFDPPGNPRLHTEVAPWHLHAIEAADALRSPAKPPVTGGAPRDAAAAPGHWGGGSGAPFRAAAFRSAGGMIVGACLRPTTAPVDVLGPSDWCYLSLRLDPPADPAKPKRVPLMPAAEPGSNRLSDARYRPLGLRMWAGTLEWLPRGDCPGPGKPKSGKPSPEKTSPGKSGSGPPSANEKAPPGR